MLPEEITALSACSCNKVEATDDLPQPDSPTKPNDSPSLTVKVTLFTAITFPSRVS